MKQWIKRILISLVVVAVVAVVGVAIFLLTFDPNAYKYKLAEVVQNRYDRTLSIDGPIELSLFPRIGLAVQDVSLSEVNSTEQFAAIKSARVAVAVWPLLFNQLVVDHIAINGFQARVVRGKDGNFNFSNLVDRNAVPISIDGEPVVPTAGQAAAGAALEGARMGGQAVVDASEAVRRADMQIDIAGLDLKDGDIQLQDAISGMAVRVSSLSIATGRVTFDQAFDVTLSANIEGGDPRVQAKLAGQGLLMLDPAAMRYAAQRLDLRLDGRLGDVQASAITARGNVAFDAGLRSLDVAGLELGFAGDVQGAYPMKGVEASVSVPRLSAHPGRQRLQIEKFALRATGNWDGSPFDVGLDAPALDIRPTEASGQGISGRVRVDGQQALDLTFGLTGLSGSADALDIKEAKFNAALRQGQRLVKLTSVSPLSLSLLQRSFALSAVKGEVDITDPELPKGMLQIPVIGSVSADLAKDLARARINAVLEGGKFDLSADVTQLAQDPIVKFGLAVDILDLDKLAPPFEPAPKPAQGGGNGEGGSQGERPVPPPPPQEKTWDFTALQGVTADGTIKVGELVVRNLKASELNAQIRVANGRLDISGLSAALYGGKVAGQLFADSKDNQLGAKVSLAGIEIDPLLTDAMGQSSLRGNGSLALDLRASGVSATEWRRTLSGSSQLRLKDGAIKGINVAQMLREARALVSGEAGAAQADVARETDFSSLEADLGFAKGIGTVRRLAMAAPLLRITQGKPAEMNLIESTLDMTLNVRVVNTSTGQGGKELAELRDLTIPLRIVGPFKQPAYSIQWRGVGSEALRRSLENKLLEEVERRTKAQAEPAPGKPDTGTGSGSLIEQETVKSLGNAIKGLLGR
ncbi:AsmA family protein [Orrella sp. JC864]|uniref:AsmA family protein n=1 Tax=Orrella sp. JC864 TaxID=3120298 RepID=UPI00300BE4E6